MQDLDGLQPERLDAVEDPLAGAEQDRRDVERELVDDPGSEGLAHGRGATRDVYAALAGGLTRLCVSGVEAVGDEVEGGPAFHLDRLVGVMGEHKHRRVVRRLGAPPAAPFLIPLAADRPEYVPPHDVGPARSHEPALCRRVGVVRALVAEMPAVELAPAFAEWILAALVGPSDETVERDRHVAGGVRHRRPPKVVCDSARGGSTLVQAVNFNPPTSSMPAELCFLFERLGLVNPFRLPSRNAHFSFGALWRTIPDRSCPGFSIRVRAVRRPESRGSWPGQDLFGAVRLEGLFAAEHVPAGDQDLAR